jgi:hypothetical protein
VLAQACELVPRALTRWTTSRSAKLLLHSALQALHHQLPPEQHIKLQGYLLSCAAREYGTAQCSRQ